MRVDIDVLKEKVAVLFNLFNKENKEQLMEWFTSNWEWCLIGFMVAEKIVKMSPTQYDDILLDFVWGNIKKMAGK